MNQHSSIRYFVLAIRQMQTRGRAQTLTECADADSSCRRDLSNLPNIHWKPRVIAIEENTHERNVKEALAIKRLTAQKGPEVAMTQDTGLIVSKL